MFTKTTGINGSGEIVGYYYDAMLNAHGFLYAGGKFTTIDFPGARNTYPYGINNAGEIVGYYEDGTRYDHGFLYAGGNFTTFDVPGPGTYPGGINDFGEIVGYYYDGMLDTHGFLASPISVTPTTYNFKYVKVKGSKTASFVVTNSGTADRIFTAAIKGEDGSMFRITSGSGSRTIKPGKNLTIKVAFKPSSRGQKACTLQITSNDAVSPAFNIPLIGTGQ
jgi:probable HAF family extracellular repeat protein